MSNDILIAVILIAIVFLGVEICELIYKYKNK